MCGGDGDSMRTCVCVRIVVCAAVWLMVGRALSAHMGARRVALSVHSWLLFMHVCVCVCASASASVCACGGPLWSSACSFCSETRNQNLI